MACEGQKDAETGRYWRAVFDANPLPMFVVDEDVRIEDFNTAAAQLLGPESRRKLRFRGGDALHCIHAQVSGCGRGEFCRDCVIRNSVQRALQGGRTCRQTHKAELCNEDGIVGLDLLVSTTPLSAGENPRVLLILEDISELLALRSLIPICAKCKKVRDDQQYWHRIDHYLTTHLNLKLTHGLCPDCFNEQVRLIKALQVA